MRLSGRAAIVTGASSGIGRGVAIQLAREGAGVVVADVTETPKRGRYHERDTVTPTAQVIRAGGGAAIFVSADVAAEGQVEAMVEAAVSHFGRLDILVNNAGIYFDTDSG